MSETKNAPAPPVMPPNQLWKDGSEKPAPAPGECPVCNRVGSTINDRPHNHPAPAPSERCACGATPKHQPGDGGWFPLCRDCNEPCWYYKHYPCEDQHVFYDKRLDDAPAPAPSERCGTCNGQRWGMADGMNEPGPCADCNPDGLLDAPRAAYLASERCGSCGLYVSNTIHDYAAEGHHSFVRVFTGAEVRKMSKRAFNEIAALRADVARLGDLIAAWRLAEERDDVDGLVRAEAALRRGYV